MTVDKRISYEMQGGVKNYKPSKMVTAPKTAKSSPDHPTAHLAYITNKEKDLLIKKNLYGSLKGKPNRGPAGIPSLQGDFGGGRGSYGGHEGPDRSGTKDTGTGNYQVSNKAVQDAYNKNRAIREANERAVDKLAGRDTRLSGGINTTSKGGRLGGLLMSGLGALMGIPGLGFLSNLNLGNLRGINPVTGEPNTQAEYEAMVGDRKIQGRIDRMTDRMLAGKTFSQKNLDALTGMTDRYGTQFGTNLSNIDKGRFGKDSLAVTNQQQITPKAKPTFSDKFAYSMGPQALNADRFAYAMGPQAFNADRFANTIGPQAVNVPGVPKKGIMETISKYNPLNLIFGTPAYGEDLDFEKELNKLRKAKGIEEDPETVGIAGGEIVPDLSNADVLNQIAIQSGMPTKKEGYYGLRKDVATPGSASTIRDIQNLKRNPELGFDVKDIMGLDFDQYNQLGEEKVQSIYDMVNLSGQGPFIGARGGRVGYANGGLATLFTRRG